MGFVKSVLGFGGVGCSLGVALPNRLLLRAPRPRHKRMTIDEAPPGGEEGADMTGSEIEAIRAWMTDRFAADDYEAIWHRRLEPGRGLSGENVKTETWFWVNALSALAALRLGAKDHPLVATAAGFADQAYRQLPDQDDQARKAMSEINKRFFG